MIPQLRIHTLAFLVSTQQVRLSYGSLIAVSCLIKRAKWMNMKKNMLIRVITTGTENIMNEMQLLDMKNGDSQFNSTHYLHIYKWFNTSCPLCRKLLSGCNNSYSSTISDHDARRLLIQPYTVKDRLCCKGQLATAGVGIHCQWSNHRQREELQVCLL